MPLIHFLIWFWHVGVLHAMRLSKKGSVSKLGLLLSLHTCSLPHCLSLAWSWCVPPETFPGVSHQAQSQKPTQISPMKVTCWAWPSHLPPKVAQQFLSSRETAIKLSASAEVATALAPCGKVGLVPPVGFSFCFGKQEECLEIYCWLSYLCSVILHMSDSTRSLTAASGILQSLTFTRQQFTVVELTTYL